MMIWYWYTFFRDVRRPAVGPHAAPNRAQVTPDKEVAPEKPVTPEKQATHKDL